MFVHTFICLWASMCMCTQVFMHVSTYLHMYTYVCACIRVHRKLVAFWMLSYIKQTLLIRRLPELIC